MKRLSGRERDVLEPTVALLPLRWRDGGSQDDFRIVGELQLMTHQFRSIPKVRGRNRPTSLAEGVELQQWPDGVTYGGSSYRQLLGLVQRCREDPPTFIVLPGAASGRGPETLDSSP